MSASGHGAPPEARCRLSDLPPAQCAHCRGQTEKRTTYPAGPPIRDLVSELSRGEERVSRVLLVTGYECDGCGRTLMAGETILELPGGEWHCEACVVA